jgi:archaemetzincin
LHARCVRRGGGDAILGGKAEGCSVITRRAFCAGALASLACGRNSARPLTIALQPLLPAPDEETLAAVEALARELLGATMLRLAPRPLPATAWYAARRRHRAEVIVRVLESRRPSGAARILGVTARDISTTHGEATDWGVLGLGVIGGRAAVASSYRVARNADDGAHARTLFSRVCVHELGHALGSPHCEAPGCLMQDGHGKIGVLDASSDFCAATRALLARAGARAR